MKLTKKGLTPRKEPNQERARETVENIFQATAHILEKEGFEKTSTNKIAQKAGISIGSLYQYFPTKEAILGKMIDYYIQKQIDLYESEINKEAPKTLLEMIETLVDVTIEAKKKEERFTKIFAQKMFSLAKHDTMKRMDTHLLNMFKEKIKIFEDEVRMENIELSLFILYQSVRIVPVAIIFDDHFKLNDKNLKKEMIYLCHEYLRKD